VERAPRLDALLAARSSGRDQGIPEAQRRFHGQLQRLGAHEIVAVGSSLKFCMVAEGLADIYPRLGPTMEWDTAAGQCVAECAGATVLDPRGTPLACNRGESLVNPHFIVNGDPTITFAIFGEQKSALQDPA
jgi:3'(2'), 5'-bisphosphate nucleotidase